MKALAAVLLGLVGVVMSLPVDDIVDLSLSTISCERGTLSCWEGGSTIIACDEANTWTIKTRCSCKRGCWISDNIHQDQAGLLVGKRATSCICPDVPVNPKFLAHGEAPSMDVNTREEHMQQDYRMCCERGNCVMQCLGDPAFCQVIKYCGKNKDGTYGKDGCCKNGKCTCKTARADSGSESSLYPYSPPLVPASRVIPSHRSVPEEKMFNETFACSEDNSGVWHCLGDPAFCYFSERCENNTCQVTSDGPRCAVKRKASINSEREAIDSPMKTRNEARVPPPAIFMRRSRDCEPGQYWCGISGESQWVIQVCTSHRNWTLSAKCGDQCCDATPDHSRAFCVPCRPPTHETDTTNGTEISAPRNNALASRSDSTKGVGPSPNGWEPGQYYCAKGPHNTSYIVVCTSEYILTMSADCGSSCCEASQDHSRAFCKPCARTRRSGISATMKDEKNALTRRSGFTKEVRQDPAEDCDPGTLWCAENYVLVCDSERHLVISADCGSGCCRETADHLKAFCQPCFRDSARKIEIAAPTTEGNILARRTISTKDIEPRACEPGTYRCRGNIWASHYIDVCNDQSLWVNHTDCGAHHCCEMSLDHSRAFCKPCTSGPASEKHGLEDLAVRTAYIGKWLEDECEPGKYYCSNSGSLILVCTSDHKIVLSADCGEDGICVEEPDYSMAFCKPRSQSHGIATELTTSTKDIRQAYPSNCEPGKYYCTTFGMLGFEHTYVLACTNEGVLVQDADCGPSGDACCEATDNNMKASCKPCYRAIRAETLPNADEKLCEPGKYYCRNRNKVYVGTDDYRCILSADCGKDGVCVEDHGLAFCIPASQSRGIEAEITEYSRPSSLTSRDATADCEPGKYYCRSRRYEPGNVLYSWIVVCTIEHELVYSADCREGDCHEDNNTKAFCMPRSS